MLSIRPGTEILEQIPHIFLVPGARTYKLDLTLEDLEYFLNRKYGITNIGIQSPDSFSVEELDNIIALKQTPADKYFCALKFVFRSYFDFDIDEKLQILYDLKQRYNFELFDGKTLEHLTLRPHELEEHIQQIQQFKKEEFLYDISPAYSLN